MEADLMMQKLGDSKGEKFKYHARVSTTMTEVEIAINYG